MSYRRWFWSKCLSIILSFQVLSSSYHLQWTFIGFLYFLYNNLYINELRNVFINEEIKLINLIYSLLFAEKKEQVKVKLF